MANNKVAFGKFNIMSLVWAGAAITGLYFLYKIVGDDDDEDKRIYVEPDPLPNNGTGIPVGWTATYSVSRIWNAFDWTFTYGGTNEGAIWNSLRDKTPDQLTAIFNEFNRLHATEEFPSMFDWFADEMSGGDLARTLDFFQGLGLSGIGRAQATKTIDITHLVVRGTGTG